MSFGTVDMIGQLADLKDVDYRNTMAISTLIELLIEKGVFSRQDFARKALELERATLTEITLLRSQGAGAK